VVPKPRLTAFPFLASLPEAVLSRLAELMTEEEFSEGATVFAEGKGGDAVYFVAKGEVLIRKSIDRQQGTFKVIALLGPGEYFGEMALLENAPRSAAAVAQSAATLLRLSSEDFHRILESDPKAGLEFFRGLVMTLSARLRQTTREMVAVFEVGRTLAQELDVRPLAARVLSLVRQSMEDDVFGAFYYWNEFTSEYDLLIFEGDWPEPLRRNRPKDDLLFHTMGIKKECVLSKDWPKDERFSEKFRAQWPGCVSFLAAPLFGLKGPLGFIVFGHGRESGLFTPGHRQVLAGVANLVAPAFENAAWRQEMESKRRLERSKSIAF
jgi:CRP/FNR family transcriptional regulator